MKTPLLDEQVEDVEKIAAAIDLPNFSAPGSGKTYTTIGTIERMGFRNGVVVGPPVSMIMWKEVLEYELDGCKVQWLKHKSDEIDPLADFYVVSYAIVESHSAALMKGNFDCLVADESQYIRTPYGARARALLGPRMDGVGGIYEAAKQTWMLSGEPIERYADDLWTQLAATHPDTLRKYDVGSLWKFERKFCRMEYKKYGAMQRAEEKSTGNINEALLNKILYQDIGAIRRTVSDKLPPVRFRDVTVALPLTGELRAYAKGKSIEQIQHELTTRDPVAGNIRRLVGFGKIPSAVDYIAEVMRKQPVLVGYWHTDVGRELEKRLQDKMLKVRRIGGDTSAALTEQYRVAFNKGELNGIVGQIAKMGVSMNLQEHGCYVIIAEDDWSAAKISQFYKRISRRGQKQSVQVDFLRCDYPVDLAIRKVRERKQAGAETILTPEENT